MRRHFQDGNDNACDVNTVSFDHGSGDKSALNMSQVASSAWSEVVLEATECRHMCAQIPKYVLDDISEDELADLKAEYQSRATPLWWPASHRLPSHLDLPGQLRLHRRIQLREIRVSGAYGRQSPQGKC